MKVLVGIDEVGRGSWAGPMLIVAAKASRELPAGLKDSKLLSKKQREELFELLIETCKFGEGWVQPEEIDSKGLAGAMRLGISRALIEVGAKFEDRIILDGNVNYCPADFINTEAIIGADIFHPLVSAASIYAKVKRDAHMVRIASLYPDYKFEQHVGYGTKLHLEMLKLHGISRIHRRSYAPIKALMA